MSAFGIVALAVGIWLAATTTYLGFWVWTARRDERRRELDRARVGM